METNNTLARQIAQCDLEALTFLEAILQRPKIYVGATRFDYVDHMLQGKGVEYEEQSYIEIYIILYVDDMLFVRLCKRKCRTRNAF